MVPDRPCVSRLGLRQQSRSDDINLRGLRLMIFCRAASYEMSEVEVVALNQLQYARAAVVYKP